MQDASISPPEGAPSRNPYGFAPSAWAERVGFVCLLVLPFLIPMRNAPEALEPITDLLGEPWKPARILATICLLALIVLNPQVRRRLCHPAFWLMGALVVMAVISSAFGVEPALSFKMLLRELGFYTVVVMLTGATLTNRWRLKLLLGSVTIAAGIEAAYAVVIHLLHLFSDEMGQALADAGMIHNHRNVYWAAIGTFEYYTVLAKYLVIALSGMLIMWRLGRTRWPHRALVGLAMTLAAAALMFSTARTAWVALFAGLVSHTVLVQRRVIYLLIALPLLVLAVGPDTVQQRVTTLLDIEVWTDANRSIQARRFGAEAAIGMLRDHPVLGVGYGRRVFSHLYEEYRPELHRDELGDAHSNVFEMAAEMGLVGVTVYLSWAIAILVTTFKRWWEAKPGRRRRLMGSLITAQVIHHVLGLALFTWKGEVGVLLALLTGVVIVMSLPKSPAAELPPS